MSFVRNFLEAVGLAQPQITHQDYETPARTSSQREFDIRARKIAANDGLRVDTSFITPTSTDRPLSRSYDDVAAPVALMAAATTIVADVPTSSINVDTSCATTDFGGGGFAGCDSAAFAPEWR